MNPFAATPVLIRNENKSLVPQFGRLTINFLPAQTRVEMLEDREHVVIPMVMLTEGVHAGSSGPVLYTPDELSKTPAIWNHKPIVVYHPEMNGQGISACDPVVVNARKVGIMMNTTWDTKFHRLKSEAWIEKPRAEKIDNRIFAAVDKNEMMELSTGFFSDLEKTPGELNGVAYEGVVRNIRPDHLALLPDKIGACSIAKGAGLLRNELSKGKAADKHILKRLGEFLGITDNELSFDNISSALCAALNEKFNVNYATGPGLWVDTVYSNFVIYSYDGKLFRLSYASSDSGVTLGDEAPVEVFRVTEFRTVDGAKFVGNQDQPRTNESIDNMNKQAMIVAILAANCGWSDQKALEGLNDKQIESIHNGVKPAKVEPPAPAVVVPPVAQPATATTSTTNAGAAGTPQTLEAWLGSAPPEVAGAVRSLLNNERTEKDQLIAKITANAELGFTKENLETLSIGNLRAIGKMAEPAKAPALVPFNQPNYSGMAPASTTTNKGPAEEEPLLAPVMNFAKDAKAA